MKGYERSSGRQTQKNLENLEEYATLNFQGCFDTVQPSTTACEYATVKFGRYPTTGSVIQPPISTQTTQTTEKN